MKYLFFILNIFFISSINAEEAIHKDININIPTPREMVKISQDMGDIYYDLKNIMIKTTHRTILIFTLYHQI